MTDTTHEAPERIWLGLDLGDINAGFHNLNTVDWGSAKTHESDVEYVRADLVQAAVAAALREAAQVARASFDGELGYDEILDLIPEGAQAALDRVVVAEQERCAKVAQRCADLADTNGDYLLICDVVAAIRKGGE